MNTTTDTPETPTRQIFSFQFTYSETIVGEAFGTSEEEVRANLVSEFGHAKDFKIDLIEPSMMNQANAQLELPYQVN